MGERTPKPWEDVPLCQKEKRLRYKNTGEWAPPFTCNGPLVPVRVANWNHRAALGDRLVCSACGHGVIGTEEQVAQSEAAQKAWEAHEAEEAAKPSKPLVMDDESLF